MPVKILGVGDITKKVTVDGVRVSSTAREKIVAVGGTVKGAAAVTADAQGTHEAK